MEEILLGHGRRQAGERADDCAELRDTAAARCEAPRRGVWGQVITCLGGDKMH
jgi:hypothetical protein